MVFDCATEFAAYSMEAPEVGPKQTYRVSGTSEFPRQAAFGENGTIVVCGSDHGRVYIFDRMKGTVTDILYHSNSRVNTITVSAAFLSPTFD